MLGRDFYRPFVSVTIVAAFLTGAAPPPPEVRLAVRNETGAALECQVLAAHWYTLAGLSLPPGATGSLALHAADGVLQTEAALPIERIFCGFAGNAWLTRGDLDLRRLAGGEGVSEVCRAVGAGVGCGE